MTVIYLEDLLDERSFSEAANKPSRRIRDAHDCPLRLSARTTHTIGRIQNWTGKRCLEV
jgi:hypothetical protein